MKNVQIDFSAVPDCVWNDIGRTFYHLVTESYKDPKNCAAYEEWRMNRES